MAKEVKWSPDAIETLDNTIDLIENNWSDREVGDFVKAAARVIEHLSGYPLMFRKSRRNEMREAVVTSYNLLIYKVYANYIAVLLIWDTRQDPKNLVLQDEP